MPSIAAQLRAVQKMKQAALNLSAACVDNLRTPENAAPLLKLYDRTLLQQDPSPAMTVLLGKLQ